MLKSQFKYEVDANVFFTDPAYEIYWKTNLKILKTLRVNRQICEEVGYKPSPFWEPLNFFNLLFEQLDITVHFCNTPFEVIEHLRNVCHENSDKVELMQLLWSMLQFKILGIYSEDEEYRKQGNNGEDQPLKMCLDMIGEEYHRLCIEFAPQMADKARRTPVSSEHLSVVLRLIKDPSDKIVFLNNRIKNCKIALAEAPEHDIRYIKSLEAGIKVTQIEIESLHRQLKEPTQTLHHSGYVVGDNMLETIGVYPAKGGETNQPLPTKSLSRRTILPYEKLFLEKNKGQALIKLLKEERIIDQNEVWQDGETNIVILTNLLYEYRLTTKPYLATIGKCLCKRFGLGEYGTDKRPSFSESLFTKAKTEATLVARYENIIKAL